jgi:hypothetical protein
MGRSDRDKQARTAVAENVSVYTRDSQSNTRATLRAFPWLAHEKSVA